MFTALPEAQSTSVYFHFHPEDVSVWYTWWQKDTKQKDWKADFRVKNRWVTQTKYFGLKFHFTGLKSVSLLLLIFDAGCIISGFPSGAQTTFVTVQVYPLPWEPSRLSCKQEHISEGSGLMWGQQQSPWCVWGRLYYFFRILGVIPWQQRLNHKHFIIR